MLLSHKTFKGLFGYHDVGTNILLKKISVTLVHTFSTITSELPNAELRCMTSWAYHAVLNVFPLYFEPV